MSYPATLSITNDNLLDKFQEHTFQSGWDENEGDTENRRGKTEGHGEAKFLPPDDLSVVLPRFLRKPFTRQPFSVQLCVTLVMTQLK